MRGQTFAKAGLAVLLSVALAACSGGNSSFGNKTTGGSSGSGTSSGGSTSSSGGGSSGGTTATAGHIILLSSSPSVSSTSSAVLTATVTDANNIAIPGYPVTFASSAGVLVPNASTTDSSGNISATLSAGNASAGTTIQVSATANPLAPVTVNVKVASSTSSLAMGTLAANGTFTAGAIAIGQTPLAAGGSSGLQVAIVDTANSNTPYTGSATVSFTSPCESQSLASIASPITSSNGTFNSTYKATGCSGSDPITASATVNGASLTATGTINVQAAVLGSIQFVAANPTTIGLKGTGLNQTSTLQFKVVDSNGNPVPNQLVDFSLSTTAGGLSVSPLSAKSDVNGLVNTTVQSGTVHTSVRVTAVIHGTTLSTESSQLTVSTGLPTQNGFSLAATTLNLVGDNYDGNTTIITARLSDRFSNPVPDGTAVSFHTECGGIEPSCSTVNGACQVTFTTQNPRTHDLAVPPTSTTPGSPTYVDNHCSAGSINGVPFDGDLGCDDHRCTVTAWAVGEESFNDCNGTGTFISAANSANNATQCPNGDFFVSLPEVFYDYNESGVFNGDFESYVDYNNNGKWDGPSGKFIGLLCNDPNCDTTQNELNVSQDLVIVMTNSTLFVAVNTAQPPAINPHNYVPPPSLSSLSIPKNGTPVTVYVSVGDTALQVPAMGTTINASLSGGSISGVAQYIVPNTDSFGYITYPFVLVGPGASSTTTGGTLTINAITPPFGNNNALSNTIAIPVTFF